MSYQKSSKNDGRKDLVWFSSRTRDRCRAAHRHSSRARLVLVPPLFLPAHPQSTRVRQRASHGGIKSNRRRASRRAWVHLRDGHEEEHEHAPPELPLHRRRRQRPLRERLGAAPGCLDLQALRRRRAVCRCRRRRTFRVHAVGSSLAGRARHPKPAGWMDGLSPMPQSSRYSSPTTVGSFVVASPVVVERSLCRPGPSTPPRRRAL